MEQPPHKWGSGAVAKKKVCFMVGFAGTLLVENVSYESSAVDMGLRFWAEGVHGVAIGQLESDDGIGWYRMANLTNHPNKNNN